MHLVGERVGRLPRSWWRTGPIAIDRYAGAPWRSSLRPR